MRMHTSGIWAKEPACAVTQSLEQHLAAVEEAQSRDELIEAKVAEMELDVACVASALDSVLDNRGYERDLKTGKAGNTYLSTFLAGSIINGTDAQARSAIAHLRELARAWLDSAAEDAVDAENNANAIEAAQARLAHDEMGDVR